MFENPPGDYAGRLIEAAGSKGTRIGNVEISIVSRKLFRQSWQDKSQQYDHINRDWRKGLSKESLVLRWNWKLNWLVNGEQEETPRCIDIRRTLGRTRGFADVCAFGAIGARSVKVRSDSNWNHA